MRAPTPSGCYSVGPSGCWKFSVIFNFAPRRLLRRLWPRIALSTVLLLQCCCNASIFFPHLVYGRQLCVHACMRACVRVCVLFLRKFYENNFDSLTLGVWSFWEANGGSKEERNITRNCDNVALRRAVDAPQLFMHLQICACAFLQVSNTYLCWCRCCCMYVIVWRAGTASAFSGHS